MRLRLEIRQPEVIRVNVQVILRRWQATVRKRG
jgi:hypothetical protein